MPNINEPSPAQYDRLAEDLEQFLQETGGKILDFKDRLRNTGIIAEQATAYWINNMLLFLDSEEFGFGRAYSTDVRETITELKKRGEQEKENEE